MSSKPKWCYICKRRANKLLRSEYLCSKHYEMALQKWNQLKELDVMMTFVIEFMKADFNSK